MKIRFTKQAIDEIAPPPGAAIYYQDDGRQAVRGLALRVNAGGMKTFCLVRRINGKQERITIGRWPDMSLEQARKQAETLNAEVASGANPADLKREKRAELTLQEAFDLYMTAFAAPKVSRPNEIRSMFNRYLGRPDPDTKKLRGRIQEKAAGGVDWSERRLTTITKEEVTRLHKTIAAAGMKARANSVRVLLNAIFNRMHDLGEFSGQNPVATVKPFDEIERERFLKSDEVQRFFVALGKRAEWFKDLVFLALATGARRGNLQSMQWEHIDLDLGIWTIPGAMSKNRKAMTIPLGTLALEVLHRRHGNGSPFVFPAPKSVSGHIISVQKEWAALLDDAAIQNLHFHDLRRSLASWMAINQTSLHVIGAALGHKSPASTKIYARLTIDPVRAAMEKAMDNLLDAGGVSRG